MKVSTRRTTTSIAHNLPLSNSTTTIKSEPLAPSSHSPSHPHRIQPQAAFKSPRHGLLRQYPKHHLLSQNLAPNRRRPPPLLPERQRHLRLRTTHRRNHPSHAQGSRPRAAVPGHRKRSFETAPTCPTGHPGARSWRMMWSGGGRRERRIGRGGIGRRNFASGESQPSGHGWGVGRQDGWG